MVTFNSYVSLPQGTEGDFFGSDVQLLEAIQYSKRQLLPALVGTQEHP